jgi:hypothetical protein
MSGKELEVYLDGFAAESQLPGHAAESVLLLSLGSEPGNHHG